MNEQGTSPDLDIYCGSATLELARLIADRLGRPLGSRQLDHFADGELHVKIEESVRGRDIYLVQSTCPPVNEHLMELLVMIDAFRRASADRITAILPYYGYARQERKSAGREPITAKLVANLLTPAGANRVVALDLHTAAIQGFFDIEMIHLTATRCSQLSYRALLTPFPCIRHRFGTRRRSSRWLLCSPRRSCACIRDVRSARSSVTGRRSFPSDGARHTGRPGAMKDGHLLVT